MKGENYVNYKCPNCGEFKRFNKPNPTREEVYDFIQKFECNCGYAKKDRGKLERLKTGKKMPKITPKLRKQTEEILNRNRNKLTEREFYILYKRYGAKDGQTHSLEEIAREYGISRERVRQIEVKAFKKLDN